MRSNKFTYITALAVGGAVTVGIYFWFIRSPYFDAFTEWSESHTLALFFALVALKTAGMVWPPFAGGVFTFGAIPVIGWLRAYAADLTGSALGSTLTYWIARRWGVAFLTRLLDAHTVAKIARFRIPRRRELEAVYLFRILGTGSVVEILCYGAGLLRIGFPTFLLGSVLSHATVSLPFFYFGKELFGPRAWTAGVIFVAFVLVVFVFRKRYFGDDAITSHSHPGEP